MEPENESSCTFPEDEHSLSKWLDPETAASFLEAARIILRDVLKFVSSGSGIQLRKYQEDVARAVVDSVVNHKGLTFVVVFPRQSGKNELQAQLEAYLLTLHSHLSAEMVKVSPTWKPQSLNAMRRLERTLSTNIFTRALLWWKEQSYIYRVGLARIYFLSAAPSANIVGATASALLECDEAQDVLTAKWDKDVAPMAASTNATRVFWGTAWTSATLLAREMRAALELQKQDGVKRVFKLTADDVAQEVPAYGKFVAGEVEKLGRNHPMVKTQFFSEEIDAQGGMFPEARQALMLGAHDRLTPAQAAGRIFAMLVDVAGEDESSNAQGALLGGDAGTLSNPGRDSTALTVVEIDLSQFAALHQPVYRVVDRRLWTGVKHSLLHGQLLSLFEAWQARYLVIDATGIGAGISSFLAEHLGKRLVPFTFNSATKSHLGWSFLAVIESGRFKDYRPAGGGVGQHDERWEFYRQLDACQMEIIPGPEKRLRWGVPDGTRDPATGELLHDDLILSAALCAELDNQLWGTAESLIIHSQDPLLDFGEVY